MKLNKIIAAAGTAGVGKNLICTVLQQELEKLGYSSKLFAFADILKEECRPIILSKSGIDILNCTREEKESVRHILVSTAEGNRATDPDFYVKRTLVDLESVDVDFKLITDCRYVNEARMVHNNNGIVLYLTLFDRNTDKFIKPANETEAITCHEVRKIADYDLIGIKKPDSVEESHEDWIRSSVQQLIKFYLHQGFIPYRKV